MDPPADHCPKQNPFSEPWHLARARALAHGMGREGRNAWTPRRFLQAQAASWSAKRPKRTVGRVRQHRPTAM
eukprot:11911871-Alexandrium_andersonii.AAC.1